MAKSGPPPTPGATTGTDARLRADWAAATLRDPADERPVVSTPDDSSPADLPVRKPARVVRQRVSVAPSHTQGCGCQPCRQRRALALRFDKGAMAGVPLLFAAVSLLVDVGTLKLREHDRWAHRDPPLSSLVSFLGSGNADEDCGNGTPSAQHLLSGPRLWPRHIPDARRTFHPPWRAERPAWSRCRASPCRLGQSPPRLAARSGRARVPVGRGRGPAQPRVVATSTKRPTMASRRRPTSPLQGPRPPATAAAAGDEVSRASSSSRARRPPLFTARRKTPSPRGSRGRPDVSGVRRAVRRGRSLHARRSWHAGGPPHAGAPGSQRGRPRRPR